MAVLPAFSEEVVFSGLAPADWTIGNPAEVVWLDSGGLDAGKTLRFDASAIADFEVGAISQSIPVEPETVCALSIEAQRVEGDSPFKFALEWMDEAGVSNSYDNSWTGVTVGNAWEGYRVEVASPARARTARILLGAQKGNICRMRRPAVARKAPGAPRLVSILLHEPAPSPAAGSRLRLRVENMGTATAHELNVTISLPEEMAATDPLAYAIGDLYANGVFTAALTLTGSPTRMDAPISPACTGVAASGAIHTEDQVLPFTTIASEETQPMPERGAYDAVKPSIKLGCFYFPVTMDWDYGSWGDRGLRKADYMKPALGFYDEALPEVSDWHIYWARMHGISYFVYDWYYNQGFTMLNDALEKGFLKSRFAEDFEFCINWCNEEGQCANFKPQDFSPEALEDFGRLLAKRYFSHRNYLRVDGKPVVFIQEPLRIINFNGGWAGAKVAFTRLREAVAAQGYPGVYLVAVQSHNPRLVDYQKAGFDAIAPYLYGFQNTPLDPDKSAPYDALITKHWKCFATARDEAHQRGLDYIPTAWAGWDNRARAMDDSVRTRGNDPAAFRKMVSLLPKYVEEDTRLALIEAWNEWGEGTYVEPGTPFGAGRLSAVRDAITDARGPYEVLVPDASTVERVDTPITTPELQMEYMRRYAKTLGFDEGFDADFNSLKSLWFHSQAAGQVKDLRIENGALRGVSTGTEPCLSGPLCLDMPASAVAAIHIVMSTEAGREGRLVWSTDDHVASNEEQGLSFPLISDGRMHEYVLKVGDDPQWKGSISTLRLKPTDAPGAFAIDSFRTAPRPGAEKEKP